MITIKHNAPEFNDLGTIRANHKTYHIQYRFDNGAVLTYSHGSKDPFMVSLIRPNKPVRNLKDVDYLSWLKLYADALGRQKAYAMFLTVYNLVTHNALRHREPSFARPTFSPVPSDDDFAAINQMVDNVAQEFPDMNQDNITTMLMLFVCYYLVMISEFYYERTLLYHRVKALAVYQMLYQKMSVSTVANYSKGKSAVELDAEMIRDGIPDII